MVGATFEEDLVELGVGGDPGIAEALGVVWIELIGAAESVVGGEEARLPFQVAVGDGVTQCEGLELTARFGEFEQIIGRERPGAARPAPNSPRTSRGCAPSSSTRRRKATAAR